MFQLWPNKPSTQNLSSAFFCHYSNSFFFTPKQSALNRTLPFLGNYELKLHGLGAASHLQLCWWLCFSQQTPRILPRSAWVRGWQGGWLPGHKEKEEALGDWKKSAFSSGHILQTGPFVPGGWYPLLTTNRSLPGLSFFSPLRKRPFSEFVLLHPPPPQICVSYSHLNQFCFPTEYQSVVSYTVPHYSRPPDSHFLTNFLLTCILTIFSFTYEFGLNWRIIYWNSAKSST